MPSASSASTARGSPEHCGVEGRVDIITGTLGKALGGASGGYTVGQGEVVDWLRQRSRPYLFSNTLPPAIARRLAEGVRPDRAMAMRLRERLHANAARFRAEMSEARLHAGGRRPSDHPGHAGRRGAGAADGRTHAGARHLRHRLLLPGGAEGPGAHPHADVGRAFSRPISTARSRRSPSGRARELRGALGRRSCPT